MLKQSTNSRVNKKSLGKGFKEPRKKGEMSLRGALGSRDLEKFFSQTPAVLIPVLKK